MDAIEAGKICRDSGFNWGRGAYWESKSNPGLVRCCPEMTVNLDGLSHPYLLEASTRGVILEWAREMTGDEYLFVGVEIHLDGTPKWYIANQWDKVLEYCEKFETEIECYAKLCQWVKENVKAS